MVAIGTYEGNDGKIRDKIGVDATISPGTGATSLGKAEDAVAAAGDTGIFVLGVRTPETPVAQTSADGDYGAIAIDQYGDVKTLLVDPDGVPLEPLPSGRAADASSTPVALSTENVALFVQPYPVGQVALIAGSGNVANASAVATLDPGATVTAHLSGFEVTGSGSAQGLPVTVTVAGLLGGTRHYTYVFGAGALIQNTPLMVQFNPPLPASAVNTDIVVTCPAGGAGNTNNTVVAHGFSA